MLQPKATVVVLHQVHSLRLASKPT